MFIDLTPQQQELRADLREYFADLVDPTAAQTMLTERHGPTYRDVIRQMGRDGWLGVGWPKEYGGKGFGEIEQQIFTNEAVRADVPLPAVTSKRSGPPSRYTEPTNRRSSSSPESLPATSISRSATPNPTPGPTSHH